MRRGLFFKSLLHAMSMAMPPAHPNSIETMSSGCLVRMNQQQAQQQQPVDYPVTSTRITHTINCSRLK